MMNLLEERNSLKSNSIEFGKKMVSLLATIKFSKKNKDDTEKGQRQICNFLLY